MERPHPLIYVTFQSRGHVANVNYCIWTSAIPMISKLARVVTCSGETPSSKSHELLIMWHVINEKTYICTSIISMTTKLGRVVTYGWKPHLLGHVTFWSRRHMANEKKDLHWHFQNNVWPSGHVHGHYLPNVFKISVAILLIMLSLLSVVLSRWESSFHTILFKFSELLALEITKSNDVQICQFILMK